MQLVIIIQLTVFLNLLTRVAEPYYRKAMERAERMMERYLPFYQYYHSGATYRDSYYFLRAGLLEAGLSLLL